MNVSEDLANFLFESANLVTLMIALGWFLFKPVRATLAEEVERQAAGQRRLAEASAQAEEQTRKAAQAMQQAETTTETRRQEILAAAEVQAKEIRERANALAEQRRERLKAELEAERQAHLLALADTIGRVAAEAVRELMATLSGPAVDLALIRRAQSELGGFAPGLAPAVVDCARALDSEGRAVLGQSLGPDFEERIHEELGAGVRVTTARGQVDASASGIARRVARQISTLVQQRAEAESKP